MQTTTEKSEVEFINVKSFDELQSLQSKIQTYPKSKVEKSFSFSELNPEIKWRAYYQNKTQHGLKILFRFQLMVSKVVRGITTGANGYFTFNQSKAKNIALMKNFCCLVLQRRLM